MKTRKDTILKFIAIPFIMIAFTVFLLSNNNVKAAEDTTRVVLKKDGENVKLSINPKEGASIASFQIGLKIEASKATDIKNVTFSWANIGNVKLKKESYDKEKGILNLYVVTEAEQNTGAEIDVGTIKVETNRSTKVTVSPIADKITASSIAHKDTKVEAKATDKVTYTTNTSGGNTGDNNQGGSTNKPEGSQGSNNGGSSNQGGNNSGNQGGSSSGNGNQGNSSPDNDSDSDDKDEEDNKKDEEGNNEVENNTIDETNSENNTMENDSIATGTLPQAGEDGNFIWIWLIVAIVGLIIALLYAQRIVRKRDWRR